MPALAADNVVVDPGIAPTKGGVVMGSSEIFVSGVSSILLLKSIRSPSSSDDRSRGCRCCCGWSCGSAGSPLTGVEVKELTNCVHWCCDLEITIPLRVEARAPLWIVAL